MPDEGPLIARYVWRCVDGFVGRACEADIQLKAVVRPGSELQEAHLDVEREVSDIDAARGLVDSWRNP